jgi:hypothetical protein
MIAWVLVVPPALVCGAIRGIPFFWCLVDCSFGVFAIIPLWFCRGAIQQIQKQSRPWDCFASLAMTG